jgi:hypothetical protein
MRHKAHRYRRSSSCRRRCKNHPRNTADCDRRTRRKHPPSRRYRRQNTCHPCNIARSPHRTVHTRCSLSRGTQTSIPSRPRSKLLPRCHRARMNCSSRKQSRHCSSSKSSTPACWPRRACTPRPSRETLRRTELRGSTSARARRSCRKFHFRRRRHRSYTSRHSKSVRYRRRERICQCSRRRAQCRSPCCQGSTPDLRRRRPCSSRQSRGCRRHSSRLRSRVLPRRRRPRTSCLRREPPRRSYLRNKVRRYPHTQRIRCSSTCNRSSRPSPRPRSTAGPCRRSRPCHRPPRPGCHRDWRSRPQPGQTPQRRPACSRLRLRRHPYPKSRTFRRQRSRQRRQAHR